MITTIITGHHSVLVTRIKGCFYNYDGLTNSCDNPDALTGDINDQICFRPSGHGRGREPSLLNNGVTYAGHY